MSASTVLNQVLILLFIILIGFYAKKRGIINEGVSKKLSELLLKVTSPFLVISSFQFEFSQEMLNNVFIVFIFAISAHALSIVASKVLYFKYPDNIKKILQFVTIYSNCGFMGFPVLESLYGKSGVLYGSVYVAAFNIFLWTNGVMIFSGKKDLSVMKKAVLNPGITSVFIGMLLFIFSIKLPYPISKTLDMVGSMTVPLSMLIVGSTFADIDFRKLFHGFSMYYGTSVRLIFIPVLTLICLKFIGLSTTLVGVCVILVAMPAAAMSTIFAEMYNGDSVFASKIVVFSTILSMVTIPLVIMLI